MTCPDQLVSASKALVQTPSQMPCTCPSLLTDLWASTLTFFHPFPTYQSDYLFKTTSLVFFKTSNDFQCSQQKPLSLTQLFVPGLLTLLPRLLSRSLSNSHPSPAFLLSTCQHHNLSQGPCTCSSFCLESCSLHPTPFTQLIFVILQGSS